MEVAKEPEGPLCAASEHDPRRTMGRDCWASRRIFPFIKAGRGNTETILNEIVVSKCKCR